ncbi:FAD:protein FMN transferase [Roseateles sp. BYS78W]|uniref:FAD:protein FMN transferase n=1 Tax=Pelomonas candidula TaxID=3299025 RepID=A0ABW7H8H6_9BURK
MPELIVENLPFQAMASRCNLRVAAPDPGTARHWADLAVAEVRRIEQTFSRYRPDSIVSRINAAAGGEPVRCDAETLALLGYADQLHRSSDGLFDITSGVLRRAWDFRHPRLPDAAELQQLCGLVGWQRVERDGDAIRLPQPGMELDFGGFGKEYAADRVAAVLHAAGARHGYVNLGGDLHALGPQPDGRPWMIGIQHPREAGRVTAELALSQGGLATSGDYERFFELDGRRYCHVLDPRTGWPVSHWQSVSVAAPLCIAAGSCTTVAMLLEARGSAFLENTGLPWLAIGPDGRPHRGPANAPDA